MNNQTDPAPMVTLFDPEFELKIEPLDIEIEDDRVNNVYVNCELEERSYIEETNLDENVEDPLAIDQEEIQASRSESNISSIKVIPIRKKSLAESFIEDENDQIANENALDDSDEYDITLNDSKDLKGAVFELDKEDIYVVNSNFELGEYAWSKLGRWPYWPSIVCPDPDTKEFTTVKESKQFGNHRLFHVEFFGGKRAWVKQKHMLSFEGLEAFEELGNSMDKVKKADFFPTGYTLKLWVSAVEECLSALEKSEEQQIELSPSVSTFSHKNTSPRSNFDNRDTFPINQEIIDESLDEDNVDVETLSFENDPVIIDEQNDPTKIADVRKSKEKSSCDKCGKSFANKYTLKTHVDDVHEGQKSHKCEECNKIFTQKSNLKRHIKKVHLGKREHTGIRDHQCNECNKAYYQKSHLNQHIKYVHRGVRYKKAKCDVCNKTFSQAGNLKIHINSVHNGQKDHKCDSCGKAFSQAGHLKSHINDIHNGQKDHKCDSCGKAFSRAETLKRHINSVHGRQNDHKCDSCGKAFSRAGSLKTHINSVHKN